nr:hypothetical protein [Tanacetum cinerariifolium]
KKLHASMPSHFVPQPREFNVVKHRNVIAPRMFKINPSQTLRVDLVPNKQSSKSIRIKSITNSQRHVIVKENVSSNTVTASSTGLVHTARSKRPQPKGNTRNDRVPSASKSSEVKKNVTVEYHRRTLLLSKNQKSMSSECNNIKLAIRNENFEIVCDTCKQCLVTANHDTCLPSSVNVVQICMWCVDSGCSKHMTRNIKLLINFVWKFLGIVRFGNDHIAAILGYGDLKWGNITITRVYFVEGLGHNLFSVGQFCDANLEVAFRRNTCFIRDLDGVDLLKGNHSTNIYTINLYDMASASPICLMTLTTPTKTLPKFKYAKEHLCPSCEQEKKEPLTHPNRFRIQSSGFICFTWTCVVQCELQALMIFVRLQAPVIIIRTDKGTEFKNHVLKEYFDSVGLTHEISTAITPQKNGVVECKNHTLVEAARTMLIFSHASLFLWAEAIATAYKLDLDQIGTPVDAMKYRSMIGALMYLMSSRPDIVHATCVCARYQAHPTEKHLKEVKKIFRYLRGTVNMGLWYTKDSVFELTGFSDADYAGCKDTFNMTMEILLEPTSNKLLVGDVGDSIWIELVTMDINLGLE